MARILLGVTGSVAATLTPRLVQELLSAGHEVQVVTSKAGQFFFDQDSLPVKVWTDTDEWPSQGYRKDDPIPHIDLGVWADLFLIAPLSANTLGQLALGLSGNCLTSIARAWPRQKPLVIAPAMNSRMWHHPATLLHLILLKLTYKLRVAWPICKRLACGELGTGAMARTESITKVVSRNV